MSTERFNIRNKENTPIVYTTQPTKTGRGTMPHKAIAQQPKMKPVPIAKLPHHNILSSNATEIIQLPLRQAPAVIIEQDEDLSNTDRARPSEIVNTLQGIFRCDMTESRMDIIPNPDGEHIACGIEITAPLTAFENRIANLEPVQSVVVPTFETNRIEPKAPASRGFLEPLITLNGSQSSNGPSNASDTIKFEMAPANVAKLLEKYLLLEEKHSKLEDDHRTLTKSHDELKEKYAALDKEISLIKKKDGGRSAIHATDKSFGAKSNTRDVKLVNFNLDSRTARNSTLGIPDLFLQTSDGKRAKRRSQQHELVDMLGRGEEGTGKKNLAQKRKIAGRFSFSRSFFEPMK